MKRSLLKTAINLLVITVTVAPSLCFAGRANASTGKALVENGSPVLSIEAFSEAELDELLSPIALYPDPLLAQVLPAATFVDQITEAQKTLNGKSDDNQIANQNWDISVKAVAHYPSVLQMLSQKLDWTTALGQAYVSQSTDVEKAIQRLRGQAKAAGNLATSDKMLVETKTESGQQVIVIEPAQPEVIYVPQYNPEVVYVKAPGPSAGGAVLAFGAGLAIGAWLNRGWHWHAGGPYYHGWAGTGWIARSSRNVNINVNRNVYVNKSYSNIKVNRNITTRNISSYRTNLQRDANVRVERTKNMNRDNAVGDRTGAKASTTATSRSKANTAAGQGARAQGARTTQSKPAAQTSGASAGGTRGAKTTTAKGGARGGRRP